MSSRNRKWPLAWGACLSFLLISVACSDSLPNLATRSPVEVSIIYDGQNEIIHTEAGNVREFLEQAGIEYAQVDLIDPPLFTPLVQDTDITIVRVTESIEAIESTVPFQRRIVRNESMSADDDPIIIQGGNPGLQEITVRIVYHDSLEFSRQQTQVTVIEPAQDEIVMIGVGAAPGNVDFDGNLAFISGGNGLVMRGSSSYPEQLNTRGGLDHRVFQLSPSGSHLLFTRASTETNQFNSLWVVRTDRGEVPKSLEVENVLWAAWNPNRVGDPQIAYTTAEQTDLLPGWEANNDLWIGDIPQDRFADFEGEIIVESYPATYGWWGGNYEWSPTGRYIAYSYADEIGLVDTYSSEPAEQRVQLHTFTEYNTRADWVWVPILAWSPDGKFMAFTKHSNRDPSAADFETWVIDVASGVMNRFVQESGMWGHPSWSPFFQRPLENNRNSSQIAFLRATNPLESQRSSYTLWLMDQDASNASQLYPPAGENSRFPHGGTIIAWGPDGREMAFIYDDSLFVLNLDNGEARRITQDDNMVSNPTWAPYGPAAGDVLLFGEGDGGDILQSPDQDDFPED